jgi:hypothetical protein
LRAGTIYVVVTTANTQQCGYHIVEATEERPKRKDHILKDGRNFLNSKEQRENAIVGEGTVGTNIVRA